MKRFRRVLIVQPYGIGDFLFLTPVLRALRLIPSVEKVDLLLGSRTENVVSQNPHVDKIYVVDKDWLRSQSLIGRFKFSIRLGLELKHNHYDLLLDYSHRPEYAFFSQFFLGIPVRAGFDYKRRGVFLTHRLNITDGFHHKHVTDFYCDVAEKAGVQVKDRFLEFFYEAEDQKKVATIASSMEEPYAIVAPGGGESWGKDAHFKRWPAKFFAEFVNQLKLRVECRRIFLIGSAAEKSLTGEIAAALSGSEWSCLDLAGKLTLREAAALIDHATLFIGNDGGLMHMAHALQTPLIAFFGPVAPEVYGPYPVNPSAKVIIKKDLECRPCYQKFRYNSACVGRECLQALSPEEALSELDLSGFWNQFKLAVDMKR